MRRRIFNSAAGVSLVLWVAAIVLWVRSYRVPTVGIIGDELKLPFVQVYSIWGDLRITSPPPPHQGYLSGAFVNKAPDGTITNVQFVQSYTPQHSASMRFYLLAILTSVLPVSWATLACVSTRRRQTNPLVCSACGYSLTDNVSGVCPECGTPVAGKAEVKA